MDTLWVGISLLGVFFILRSFSWFQRENNELNRAFPNGMSIKGCQPTVKFGHRWFLDDADKWHTISCSFDGQTMDFYLDGILLPTFFYLDPEQKHDPNLSISLKVERKDQPDAKSN